MISLACLRGWLLCGEGAFFVVRCSGRHGGLPLQLDVRRAQPTFDLRSSLLTLGKANASIALLSLNRRLHFSFFTFHFSLRAGAVSAQRGYSCGA